MSTQTIVRIFCDSCREEIDEPADSRFGKDLCDECVDVKGLYVCRECQCIHDDSNLCESLKRKEDEHNRWYREHEKEIKAAQFADSQIPF